MPNSFLQHDTLFTAFPNITLKLFFNNIGDTNFKTGVSGVSPNAVNKVAVELPYTISKEWFKKITDTKYEKGFVFKHRNLTPNFYIIYDNKRYNVKECIDLTGDYFLVTCAAAQNEQLFQNE